MTTLWTWLTGSALGWITARLHLIEYAAFAILWLMTLWFIHHYDDLSKSASESASQKHLLKTTGTAHAQASKIASMPDSAADAEWVSHWVVK